MMDDPNAMSILFVVSANKYVLNDESTAWAKLMPIKSVPRTLRLLALP